MKISRKDIMTVPNLLSLIRLLMIPGFVYLYMKDEMKGTAALLLLSGMTDVADGYIARRFNQISNFGKVFDPVADKLTQAAMLLCLTSRYPAMLLPLILLTVKECFAAVTGMIVIKRTGTVLGAKWHGKVSTLLLYGLMILHVLWEDIPVHLSNILTIGCVAMMLASLVLYAGRNLQAIHSASMKRE